MDFSGQDVCQVLQLGVERRYEDVDCTVRISGSIRVEWFIV